MGREREKERNKEREREGGREREKEGGKERERERGREKDCKINSVESEVITVSSGSRTKSKGTE